jgi:NodT family efflux transporter outer membrane factor (OMF) lipoprotein
MCAQKQLQHPLIAKQEDGRATLPRALSLALSRKRERGLTPKARRVASTVSALAAALALAGCAAQGPREPRAQIKPNDSYASAQSFAAPASQWPAQAWWKAYGDSQLDALIDEALAGSPSIAIADARLRRAQAYVQVSGAAMKPQLSANTSISQTKQSYNYLSPRSGTPEGWNDYGRSTLDFSWEIDFWGKNRAALASATSEAEASRADAAQARLTLATSIASSYSELAREYAALDTAKSALQVRIKTTELFRGRNGQGLETLGSVRQVESRQASAQADVLAIEEQIALEKNRIAALMGAGPDRGLAIKAPAQSVLARSFSLPSNLEADLMGRRPDVAAARMRAEAAAKRIKQAEAAFYPNVNLTAYLGVQSLGLNMLTQDGSSIGSVGPAISLPIFTGGKLRGQLRNADAEYAEAVASYEKAVVQALQDVADAATSQKALGGRLAATDDAVKTAREAWNLQNDRYTGGLSTYLDVLSAEDTLLSNLRAQSDLQSRALSLDVALVKALGGGYQTN